MSEPERDRAAEAAFGALPPEDIARLEEEAAKNPALAAQLAEYRATVATLETGVARVQPPADLFDGVLAHISAEADAPPAPAPPPRPSRERRRRLWPAFAGGAAVAAAVAIVLVLVSGDALGPPEARAAVRGTEEFPAVTGEALLYAPDQADGRLVLDLSDVPPAGEDEHYEVWVLRRSTEGAMEAVGAFSTSEQSVTLEFRLPGAGDYEAVDVSVEPDGGPAAHSGRSLAGGVFERSA